MRHCMSSPDKGQRQTIDAFLSQPKTFIAAILAINLAYILSQIRTDTDPASLAIAVIPTVLIITLIITFARDEYVRGSHLRSLKADSYIPSLYKQKSDLRVL